MFTIQTRGPGLYPFTDAVAAHVAWQGTGLLTLMIRHTSASLLIQENADPEVQTAVDREVSRHQAQVQNAIDHTARGDALMQGQYPPLPIRSPAPWRSQ